MSTNCETTNTLREPRGWMTCVHDSSAQPHNSVADKSNDKFVVEHHMVICCVRGETLIFMIELIQLMKKKKKRFVFF